MTPTDSHRHPLHLLLALLTLLLSTAAILAQQGSSPLKIFILAGQSNMEGHGEMIPVGAQGTLEYLVDDDPGTYGHLKDGANWAERDDVWISYMRGGTTLLNDKLSAGFGASAATIGPELQFGVELGDYLGEQVLLIKTAWGGKSLYVDFRPPTSGWSVNPPVAAGQQGYYYQQMLSDVSNVIANLSTYFPGYNVAGGYEFAGFGWHQGWNDRVNGDAVAEYEQNMENFIIDVRSDLVAIHPSAANLPFVIATTGIGGLDEAGTNALALMDAQLAMENFGDYPDFEDNVAVVDTREFWRDPSESPSTSQGYHWNRNAESYFLIGQSMATHMRVLLDGGDTTPPDPSPMIWATTPTAAGEGEITMTATTATDIIGVEYFFECTTAGGNDSGWQDSPTYLNTGLSNSTSYSYQVKARDKSPDQNETGWSSLESVTTTPADTTAPTPNPVTWAVAPTPVSSRVITMTADTASDPSGVEYFFTNTTISGHNSGWQDSPKYTDAALEPSTSYTYEVKARDKSVAATETTPSAGAVATTLDPPAPGALIYEPFEVGDGTLNGNAGGTGLSGNWSGSSLVTAGSLSYGALQTSGGRATTNTGNQFDKNQISPGSTLIDAGLMADGATLWASVLIAKNDFGGEPASGDSRTYVSFGAGQSDGFDRVGDGIGGGFTVAVDKIFVTGIGGVTAQAWNDGGQGGAEPGATRGATDTSVADGATFLAVFKFTWGEFGSVDDKFEVFLPDTNLVLGSAVSTIEADFDQLGAGAFASDAFDTISFSGGRPQNGVPEVDEIRFGASYDDVVIVAMDSTAPTPDPMTWASVPAAAGEDQITMTASTATDPSGVEYFFHCTAGGNDSAWQDSPTYTDTGLIPSTSYSYQVKARDKSSSNNETGFSSLESATTTATDNTAPTPNPMTWESDPAAISSTAITMTASTASDPSGVEYFFTNTSVSGHDSDWQDSASYTDTGLAPSTSYTYEVIARDKSSSANPTGPSAAATATTEDVTTTPLIYEPFEVGDGTLNGNAGGTGLPGNWSGSSLVTAGSLSYGALQTSGGRATTNTGNQFDKNQISPGSTLTDAGLMADGATLWASVLIAKNDFGGEPASGDSRTYVSFGAGQSDGFDRVGDGIGGGFTVAVDKIYVLGVGGVTAQAWNDGGQGGPEPGATRGATDTSVADGATFLAVFRFTWGAFGSVDDKFEVFLPDTSMVLGSAVSTIEADFDQLGAGAFATDAFDTISFSGGRPQNGVPEVDEIRFGASYDSVVVQGGGGSDYSVWDALYPGADLSDPAADYDGDGLSNNDERLFGLDPTDPSSVNPFSIPLDSTAGTLSYTRRDTTLTSATYTVWTSTTLQPGSWAEDTGIGSGQVPGAPDVNGVETVAVTLSPALLDEPTLFVRIQAEE